jgi:hypothetical protein
MLTSQEVYQEVRRRGNPNIGAKSNQVHPDTAATPVRPTDPNTELAEDDTAEVLDSPQDRRSHVDNCSPLSEGKQDAHPSLRREPAHPNQTIENNCTSIQPSTSLAKHEANSNSARQPEESCTGPKHNAIVSDQQVDGEENLRTNAYVFDRFILYGINKLGCVSWYHVCGFHLLSYLRLAPIDSI